MTDSPPSLVYTGLSALNRFVCRVMYGVNPGASPFLPTSGPAILVSDHSTMGDPLVLLTTAGRPIVFLMAKEIYDQSHVRWVFRAFSCIPVKRGTMDVKAIRAMLKTLQAGQVVGVFPEGGIDNFRDEEGHLGVAYLALKTGAPIVPTSIRWASQRPETMWKTILCPGRAMVTYGEAISFPAERNPKKDRLAEVTSMVMKSIRDLQKKTP